MKKPLTICLFIVCSMLGILSSAYSQTITIKDQKTKEPIAWAFLRSEDPKASATTNEKGQADITAFQGAEKIIISRLGYKTITKSYADLESLSFELLMQPSPFEMHEIVVSATRWRQASSDVPSKIISISPTQVALQNPQTAADLLGVSGKVFIQKSQQAGGSPMIRGFATNRLLYTVDGVRMNTAIFRAGNIQNVISLDPLATENAEVFLGPGSVIYGSDAIGGVMSFQTLAPRFSLSDEPLITGKAVARYSSANNEKTGHLDVNLGWRKWALVTSISSFDFDHLRQGSKGPNDYLKPYYVQRQDDIDRVIAQDDPLLQIPSAYSQKNLMQKVRFQPNEEWDFQYGFHYSETSPYSRYDRHNQVRKGLPRYAEWNYGPQKWMMNNLNITHHGDNAVFNFLLQAGLRYNQFILDAEFDTTFYPFPFTTTNLNNGALTGSIGGVYRPSDSWVISVNFATAFRSPNGDDMGKVFDSEPGSVVVPNPDLEAEYATNVDFSITKVFGDVLRTDLAGYYTSLQNALVRRDFTLNGQDYIIYDDVLSRVQAMQNAAVANVYGIQAGIELKLPAGFDFSSDFNYQEGKEELDDGTISPSRHAAPWFGVSRLTYNASKLSLQLYAVYQGERKHEDLAEEEKGKTEIYAADADGNTYAPGWYTLNFKAIYRFTDYLSVSAGIENLTDQRYRPYSSGISGPGRVRF